MTVFSSAEPIEARSVSDGRSVDGARLKTELLAAGLRVQLPQSVADRAKPPLRVRSGSCGGLDVVLSDGTWVNCPVHERFARSSPYQLTYIDGSATITDGEREWPVRLVPAPAYYRNETTSGRRMARVGQLCSDRLGVGMTNICKYWRSEQSRCRFCSIGRNVRDEDAHKAVRDIVETVIAAVADPIAPAHHVLLGGGTPEGPDAGAIRIAETARQMRQVTDVSIYAMLTPPHDLGYLDLLSDAGVDEIGMNIEVFSAEAARRFIPGKHAAIGLDAYWSALERAVQVFGPLKTRSIAVIGLEDQATTVAGVGRLASMGVLPILSPLRPLEGTQLAGQQPLPARALWELTLAAAEEAARHGMPLGPLCVACQSNTLTIPGHQLYRLY